VILSACLRSEHLIQSWLLLGKPHRDRFGRVDNSSVQFLQCHIFFIAIDIQVYNLALHVSCPHRMFWPSHSSPSAVTYLILNEFNGILIVVLNLTDSDYIWDQTTVCWLIKFQWKNLTLNCRKLIMLMSASLRDSIQVSPYDVISFTRI
jgi:hypothetical protein